MFYTTNLLWLLNFFIALADAKRTQFATEKFTEPHIARLVDRGNIFNQVIDLFSDDHFLKEYPVYIQFERELAVDSGGVRRDMLSAFWDEAYLQFFDGSNLLVPTIHPNVDISLLPKLGLILSHGYLVCGYLPTRISFPALASILIPQVTFPTDMLIASFAESLSVYEATKMKEALDSDTLQYSERRLNVCF